MLLTHNSKLLILVLLHGILNTVFSGLKLWVVGELHLMENES